MPRHVAEFLIFSTLTCSSAALASAQSLKSGPILVGQQASAAGGRVHGSVRDDAGLAVVGASVIALGSAPVPLMARSDSGGRFSLTLPPGDYVLRATRDGYVSTYREPLRILGSTQLERNITLVRQGTPPTSRVVLAGVGTGLALDGLPLPPSPGLGDSDGPEHGHDETAWRLRHLAPTALRDIGAADSVASLGRPDSAPGRSSLFANANFSGQVNFLTTSSVVTSTGWSPAEWPRRIASASVGAPLGSFGDWTIRGAMAAGSLSSWAVLAEYVTPENQPHVVSAGFCTVRSCLKAPADCRPWL